MTLTHRNILNNGYFVGRAMALSEQDRICIPVPLYHCFGMVMGNLGAVTHGAAMVFPAKVSIRWRRCRRSSRSNAPRSTASRPCSSPSSIIPSSKLRLSRCDRNHGGRALPDRSDEARQREMHMRDITIAYGMTETSPVSFQSAIDDPIERRVTTVGRIQPHVEVKIVDPRAASSRAANLASSARAAIRS